MYKIIRMYFNRPGRFRTLQKNVTKAEAMRHCNDPETSSTTCKLPSRKRITRRNGPWFDGWTEM